MGAKGRSREAPGCFRTACKSQKTPAWPIFNPGINRTVDFIHWIRFAAQESMNVCFHRGERLRRDSRNSVSVSHVIIESRSYPELPSDCRPETRLRLSRGPERHVCKNVLCTFQEAA